MSSIPKKDSTTNSSQPTPNTGTNLPRLSILIEDDEFEEFPVEDWQVDTVALAGLKVQEWEEGWDDEDGNPVNTNDNDSEFKRHLREEVERANSRVLQQRQTLATPSK
jgi:26 proteasome complex subunit DSS1